MKSSYQTPARRALLAFFEAHADRHYTAEQICARLCDEGGARIGKSTVYRQLPQLCEQGLLRRFEDRTPDGGAVHVYQYAPDERCERHFHLKCLACGRVAHLDCDHTAELLAHVCAVHHFSIDCGSSILHGLCADCRQTAKENPKEDCHA